MAEMYGTVDRLANALTLYTTLQGITMQLLILRLIKILSAQKRLSILTSAAIKVNGLGLSDFPSVLTRTRTGCDSPGSDEHTWKT